MALQKRLVVCGPQLAAFSMIVRFLTGPAVMAAVSIAVGLRGRELHIAVVQVSQAQLLRLVPASPLSRCHIYVCGGKDSTNFDAHCSRLHNLF